mmetsp:Transcript_8581/g.34670  ORF Transcript_8581/g.34670 Transcript_8581/m.34670 type:complete len:360 (+) Transcript_8581:1351-2430(+)
MSATVSVGAGANTRGDEPSAAGCGTNAPAPEAAGMPASCGGGADGATADGTARRGAPHSSRTCAAVHGSASTAADRTDRTPAIPGWDTRCSRTPEPWFRFNSSPNAPVFSRGDEVTRARSRCAADLTTALGASAAAAHAAAHALASSRASPTSAERFLSALETFLIVSRRTAPPSTSPGPVGCRPSAFGATSSPSNAHVSSGNLAEIDAKIIDAPPSPEESPEESPKHAPSPPDARDAAILACGGGGGNTRVTGGGGGDRQDPRLPAVGSSSPSPRWFVGSSSPPKPLRRFEPPRRFASPRCRFASSPSNTSPRCRPPSSSSAARLRVPVTRCSARRRSLRTSAASFIVSASALCSLAR